MMRLFTAMLAGLTMISAPAFAADAAVEKVINGFVAAFNAGYMATATATHADDAHIVDELPPYFWGGHDVVKRWAESYAADAAAKGITDPKVVIGAPTREIVTGDRAYVIVPSLYTFKQKGIALTETAQMTFVLAKTGGDWRILSWTWTGPDPSPVK